MLLKQMISHGIYYYTIYQFFCNVIIIVIIIIFFLESIIIGIVAVIIIVFLISNQQYNDKDKNIDNNRSNFEEKSVRTIMIIDVMIKNIRVMIIVIITVMM